jgi:hypothetical protein
LVFFSPLCSSICTFPVDNLSPFFDAHRLDTQNLPLHGLDIRRLVALIRWRARPSKPSFPNTASVPPRISLERDAFTDKDHQLLDAKILKVFSLFQEFNREPDLPSLLSNITLDKRLVTLKSNEAEELIQQEPSIIEILRQGWKAASFKEVRQLGVVPCHFSLVLNSSYHCSNPVAQGARTPKRSAVPVEQRASTRLCVFISLSYLILWPSPFS